MGVVESAVTSNFRSNEIGLFERFVLVSQLHFSHNESLVVAIKLIDLKDMLAAMNEIASLVDDPWLADAHQILCVRERNLDLELITSQPCTIAWTFDGKVSLAVSNAHTYRPSIARTYVALTDAAAIVSLIAKLSYDQELTLYLEMHFLLSREAYQACDKKDNQRCYDVKENLVGLLTLAGSSLSRSLCFF